MKKLLLKWAEQMEPGIARTIVKLLASKTPKLYRRLQVYCALLIGILGAVAKGLSSHAVPDFPYEDIVIQGIEFVMLILGGIGGAMHLTTEDPGLHGETVVIDKAPIGPPTN